MPELVMTLQKGSWMEGNNVIVTGWNITILLDDVTLYEPTEDLLVEVKLVVKNQKDPYYIAQRRAYVEIQPGEPARLPLEGTLWIIGKPEETELTDYNVSIYYVRRRE